MASGEQVVQVVKVVQPATLFAPLVRRSGASSPAEQHLVYQFDAAAIWYLDFLCYLQGYDGGGLTFTTPWGAATATSGVTRWGMALRRIADDAEDVDVSHTYDYNAYDDTAPTVSGEIVYPTVAFTSGADMDSIANNELFWARVRREATHANDTMTGFAELWGIIGKET